MSGTEPILRFLTPFFPTEILNRLQIDATSWQATLEKLTRSTKKVGSYFGGSDRLKEVATQRDRRFVKNVTGRNSELTAPHAV